MYSLYTAPYDCYGPLDLPFLKYTHIVPRKKEKELLTILNNNPTLVYVSSHSGTQDEQEN